MLMNNLMTPIIGMIETALGKRRHGETYIHRFGSLEKE
ncbi:hypothetical protein ATCR1_02730 [Agrobacterium tumefaciens CCNWGS0286]|nr:hypothetical protein ATCR1_02730 [Agrobacterium tumefaciens CCNWGS0286]